ncbi:glycosyltransferase family 4 protein [Candidatus Cloacimonadota bacterium]
MLLVSCYDSSFVKADIKIFAKHFHLEILELKGITRNTFGFIKMTFKIFMGMIRNEIAFCWFADFAAFLAVKAANLFHKKVYVIVGGYEVSTLPGYGGLNKKKGIKRLKYTLNNATKVLTISDFSKSEIDALGLNIVPEKISIGVDLQKEFPAKTNTVITSGSATKELYQLKGLDVFAKATINLINYKIKIIGPFEEDIKHKLSKMNPNIEFTGKLAHEEFLTTLKEAKVFCQLSQRESFGLALLEAMNFGCIPVISRAGAMPEILGKTGFSCEYGDVENTIIAIQNALKSDQEEAVLNRVKENFTIEHREEKLIKLINQEL